METKEIKIRDLRRNDGQLEGLPRNPRKISKKQLEKLKKSLTDAPEMLRLRELICVEHPDGPVVIAGNQRLEAAKALGWETLPCKVLPADTDPAKLREYAIKDNLPFGGSGTTLIAAEQLNRKCYMMELDPLYCDVIIARWEKLTGKKATKIN